MNALKNGTKSRGSFEQVEPLAEAVTLANIALRVPYKRLLWDAQKMEFTNSRGQQARAPRTVPARVGEDYRLVQHEHVERAVRS